MEADHHKPDDRGSRLSIVHRCTTDSPAHPALNPTAGGSASPRPCEAAASALACALVAYTGRSTAQPHADVKTHTLRHHRMYLRAT
jgi:hypothetical protein